MKEPPNQKAKSRWVGKALLQISWENDRRQYGMQGTIVEELDDHILVQLYEWLGGSPSHAILLHKSALEYHDDRKRYWAWFGSDKERNSYCEAYPPQDPPE